MIQREVVELRRSECRRENQMRVGRGGGWYDIQGFQRGKAVVHSLDDLPQTWNRQCKGYASHAITVLEGKHDSSFVFGGEIVVIVMVKNDERKGRGMCEHFCHGRAT